MWLVGRWRCLSRTNIGGRSEYDAEQNQLTESFLEYFDVFYPYINTNISIELSPHPKYRKISAQMLSRVVDHEPPFGERLIPIQPYGEYVEISKEKIRIGNNVNRVSYSYSYITNNQHYFLVLETSEVRCVLQKWASNAGDIKNSFIQNDLIMYSRDDLKKLLTQYEKLVEEKCKNTLP